MLLLEYSRKIGSDLSRQGLSFCLMSIFVAVQGICDPECITDFVCGLDQHLLSSFACKIIVKLAFYQCIEIFHGKTYFI